MDQTPLPVALGVTPAPKTPLLPQAENLAFTLRMRGLDGTPEHSAPAPSKTSVTPNETAVTQPKAPVTRLQNPAPEQLAASKGQVSNAPQREIQQADTETTKSDNAITHPSGSHGAQQTSSLTPQWTAAGFGQAPDASSPLAGLEPTEAEHANLPLAAQESHILLPEPPKASATSEILLHLTGNDQSSAAIRVADRAGTVSVSVHASDPVLRESLRSNLGELSTHLNNQGWKADEMKPAAVAAQSGNQQDAHEGGQRGSHQQQPGGDRQAQRDRRANGGQWQQELDQQISGGDAQPGGNG
jgi:hypothetical protein